MMKTSQKNNGFMQKKCFHMRFFNLNISTGLLKVYEQMGPSKKPKQSINMRNRVIKVVRL